MAEFSEDNFVYKVEVLDDLPQKGGNTIFMRDNVDFNKALKIIEDTVIECEGFVQVVNAYPDCITVYISTGDYVIVITPKVGYENNKAIADAIKRELP